MNVSKDIQNVTDPNPYKKCWANVLGDCDGPMSLEHIFSKATWRKKPKTQLMVKGMANMPDRLIAPDGPKAKILCKHHNSLLSPLDSEAMKLANGLHNFADGAQHTIVHLSGLLLERWALKTVINYLAAGFADDSKWLPNGRLVRNAFGLESFPAACGLYVMSVDDYQPISTEQQGVIPLWEGSPDGTKNGCVGAIVYLHGATFFVLLRASYLEHLRIHGLDLTGASLPLTFDRLTYHSIAAQIGDAQGHATHVLFDWA